MYEFKVSGSGGTRTYARQDPCATPFSLGQRGPPSLCPHRRCLIQKCWLRLFLFIFISRWSCYVRADSVKRIYKNVRLRFFRLPSSRLYARILTFVLLQFSISLRPFYQCFLLGQSQNRGSAQASKNRKKSSRASLNSLPGSDQINISVLSLPYTPHSLNRVNCGPQVNNSLLSRVCFI